MAVDLADYAEVLRREITPPESTLFASMTEEQLAMHLADAFWEARLDGFLTSWETDEDAVVNPVKPSGQDIPREMVALVVLYAGIKLLRNRLANANSTFRAKAGPVEYETRLSANVLTEMLRQLNLTKQRLLDGQMETPTCLIDGFTIRQLSPGSYGGFLNDLFHQSFALDGVR